MKTIQLMLPQVNESDGYFSVADMMDGTMILTTPDKFMRRYDCMQELAEDINSFISLPSAVSGWEGNEYDELCGVDLSRHHIVSHEGVLHGHTPQFTELVDALKLILDPWDWREVEG